MTAPESTTSARKMTAAERRLEAVRYRTGGKTYDEIGSLLGITKQAAHALVKKALQETLDQTAESTEELRRLELERLDLMRNAIWGGVIRGDLGAIDRALRISKRASELTGIDAPIKQDVTSGGEKITLNVVYVDKQQGGGDA